MDFSQIKDIILPILPEGYTRLEYIRSTGTQYIDTGISGDSDGLEFEIDYDSNSLTHGHGIFGNYIDEDTNCFKLTQIGSIEIGIDFNDSPTQMFEFSRIVNGRNTITINNKQIVCNGEKYAVNSMPKSKRNTSNILLFTGGPNLERTHVFLYGFKIKESGEYLRNFVPCKNENNEAGLYDTIENRFYRNQGTSSFFTSEISLPDGFTLLEYIEADKGQYIDIGIYLDQDTRINLTYMTDSVADGEFFAYGAGGEHHQDRALEHYPWSGTYQFNRGESHCLEGVAEVNKKVNAHSDATRSYVADETGNYLMSFSHDQQNFTSPKTLTLLALNRTSGLFQSTARARIYYCDITSGGRNLVLYPCLNPDGIPGLYSHQRGFFRSATGEDFIAGPVAELPTNGYVEQIINENGQILWSRRKT